MQAHDIISVTENWQSEIGLLAYENMVSNYFATPQQLWKCVLPDDFKRMHLKTILKKLQMPKDDLYNYRSISKVKLFFSEVFGKIYLTEAVLTSTYMTYSMLYIQWINNFTLKKQPFYKCAMIQIIKTLPHQPCLIYLPLLTQLTPTLSLDVYQLSTTFSGTALGRFSSHLTEVWQSIKVRSCFLDKPPTSYGDVPQGFVLGSFLFTLYDNYPNSQLG